VEIETMKSMKATLLAGVITALSITTANAASVGDKVYVIFGSGSSARVESGTVTATGPSRSKVDWDYCYRCDDWQSNSTFYYDRSAAYAKARAEDAGHVSIGEAAGAAAILGILYCLSEGC
jgi:hypothetical protein